MAYSEETRRALRAAYVYKALSLEAAADQMKIAFGTASRWKRDAKETGDDWDRARAAARLGAEGAESVTQLVLEEFVTLFQSTMEQVKNDAKASGLQKAEALSRLSDAYHKTMSAVAKGSPKLNKLAVAMEVIKMLTDFIVAKHPSQALTFVDMLEPFGEHLTQELT